MSHLKKCEAVCSVNVLNWKGMFHLFEDEVLYNNVVCRLIWNYGNGKCEILFFDEVVLVNESELTRNEPALPVTQ